MKRRGFLKLLVGVPAALVVAPAVVAAAVPDRLVDRKSGVAIRFVQQYDVQTDQMVSRMDWLCAGIDGKVTCYETVIAPKGLTREQFEDVNRLVKERFAWESQRAELLGLQPKAPWRLGEWR